MPGFASLALLSLGFFSATPALGASVHTSSEAAACSAIQQAISSASAVYYPGSANYTADIDHFAVSSNQNSTCTVEPGTAEDVSAILKIVGSTRTPFAVKGAGHTFNQNFSSTLGVQIAMSRFNQVIYNEAEGTATIGMGLTWDVVYDALDVYNVSVVGGRAPGVGVGGFSLGGGYSFQTNEYGLTVDNIVSLELVLPNGTITNVTNESDADLFWALRGGLNNYGIVTTITMDAHAQGAVWGGQILYDSTQADAVAAAMLNYSSGTSDEYIKSGMVCTYMYLEGEMIIMVNLYYNAPTAPAGVYNQFLAIPSISSDIGTRSYYSLLVSAGTQTVNDLRGIYETVSHTALTSTILNAVVNETQFWSNALGNDSLALNAYVIEPFMPAAYSYAKVPSAYPPLRNETVYPMNVYNAWTDPAYDDEMILAAKESTAQLQNVAASEGLLGSFSYVNYAIYDATLESLYGDNVARLTEIKHRVDPENIMGLTGGFKFW